MEFIVFLGILGVISVIGIIWTEIGTHRDEQNGLHRPIANQ